MLNVAFWYFIVIGFIACCGCCRQPRQVVTTYGTPAPQPGIAPGVTISTVHTQSGGGGTAMMAVPVTGYPGGYPPQGYAQGYPPQGYTTGYPQQGYTTGYPQQGYTTGYPPEGSQPTYSGPPSYGVHMEP